MTFQQWWENTGLVLLNSQVGEIDPEFVYEVTEMAWVEAQASVEED